MLQIGKAVAIQPALPPPSWSELTIVRRQTVLLPTTSDEGHGPITMHFLDGPVLFNDVSISFAFGLRVNVLRTRARGNTGLRFDEHDPTSDLHHFPRHSLFQISKGALDIVTRNLN